MATKWTPFRAWVHQLWITNCEEHSELGQKPYEAREYFNQFKFWLKREYQHQKAKND